MNDGINQYIGLDTEKTLLTTQLPNLNYILNHGDIIKQNSYA